jgi:branched-chain amino acid transport system permease protein
MEIATVEVTANFIDQILVFVVFAVSLNLVLGYAGILTVAHAAFGAIGCYVFLGLMGGNGFSFIPALIVGAAVAGAFGLLIGFAGLRLEPLWMILLTLAVQLNWSFLFMIVVKLFVLLGIVRPFRGVAAASFGVLGHPLTTPTQDLPFLAIAAALVFLLCYRLGESPYGRILRGIRDDEVATSSLGKNVALYKLSVFAFSAAMAGLAGVLLSVQASFADPNLFSFTVSVEIIAMVMIGGRGNMVGSVIGAALVILATPFFEYVLKLSTNVAPLAQGIAYGVALVLILYLRPQGILPEGTSLGRAAYALAQRSAALAGFVRRARGFGRRELATATASAEVSTMRGPARRSAAQRSVPPVVRVPPVSDPGPSSAVISSSTKDRGRDVVVEVRGISKAFGATRAVDEMSMTLRRRTITALVGPNGAGKTTVFNVLTGALPLDRGRVYLHGNDVTGLRPDVITRCGMARSFQDVRIFPSLSVLDNVVVGVQHQPGQNPWNLFTRPILASRAERAARAHAHNWLRFIEMEHRAQVLAGALSFGEQKLVALARILATDSDVLLLDEPCSGIDQVWIDEMVAVIKQVRDAGRTVCVVEHNLEVVSRLADHVYFMELGSVTAEGTFAELTGDPRLTKAYFGTL